MSDTPPAAAAALAAKRASRPAQASAGNPGYLLSSFDLRAGLEVSALALTALPAEVLGELTRLRLSWDI